MPGGKAAVYTGILPFTQNETGLAVVLGHEVAHALADHGNERMSEELVANMGGKALSVALSQRPQQTQQLFMKVYGVGLMLDFCCLTAVCMKVKPIASASRSWPARAMIPGRLYRFGKE